MPNAPKKKIRPWSTIKEAQSRSIDMRWFYNSPKWRRFSKAYKKRHPDCVDCLEEGIIEPTAVTDHIVRYIDGGEGFDLDHLNDIDFEPRCQRHHNSRSGKQSHGFKGGMG